jgi:hypothetical protein
MEVIRVTFGARSLAQLNQLLPYSFREVDLALWLLFGYGYRMPEADFAEGSKVGSNSVTMTPGVVYVNDLPRFEGVTEAGRSFLAPYECTSLVKTGNLHSADPRTSAVWAAVRIGWRHSLLNIASSALLYEPFFRRFSSTHNGRRLLKWQTRNGSA